ncbi:MAG: hypothetical protein ACJ77A_05660 [Actinomycetota bacterium]
MVRTVRRGLVSFALVSVFVLALPLVAWAAPGDLDPTFSGDGMQTTDLGDFEGATTAVPLSGGRLLVLGRTGTDVALVQYRNNGHPDPAFGGGDGITTADLLGNEHPYNGLAVLPSGKILVAAATEGTGVQKLGLLRFTATGAPDTTFGGGDGKLTVGFGHDFDAYDLAVLPSGKILVSGELYVSGSDSKFIVARLRPTGSLDTSFGGGDGFVTTQVGPRFDGAWRVLVDSTGRILVGGWSKEGVGSSSYDAAAARYTAGGAPDTTFSGDGKLVTQVFQNGDDYLNGLALQGSKIVAGVYADDGSRTEPCLLRYLPNGKLDPTFGGGDGEVLTPVSADIEDVAVDSTGRIVAAGQDSTPQLWVGRYQANGKVDTTFGTGGFSSAGFATSTFVKGMTLASGGKVVVVGGTTAGDFAVARFLP